MEKRKDLKENEMVEAKPQAEKSLDQVRNEIVANWKNGPVTHVRKRYMHNADPIFVDRG